MTAADLANMIAAAGAELTLTASGRLRITGADVDRWHPVIAQYRQELTEETSRRRGQRTSNAVVTQRNHGGER